MKTYNYYESYSKYCNRGKNIINGFNGQTPHTENKVYFINAARNEANDIKGYILKYFVK